MALVAGDSSRYPERRAVPDAGGDRPRFESLRGGIDDDGVALVHPALKGMI